MEHRSPGRRERPAPRRACTWAWSGVLRIRQAGQPAARAQLGVSNASEQL